MWVASTLHPRAVHPLSHLVPAHTAPPLQSDWSQAQCCSCGWNVQPRDNWGEGSRSDPKVMWGQECHVPLWQRQGSRWQVNLQELESSIEQPQQSPVTQLHASVPRGCHLLGLVANYRTNYFFFQVYTLQCTFKTKYVYYTLLFFVKNKSLKYSYQSITSKWCLSLSFLSQGKN